jgi:hypothetical protein
MTLRIVRLGLPQGDQRGAVHHTDTGLIASVAARAPASAEYAVEDTTYPRIAPLGGG